MNRCAANRSQVLHHLIGILPLLCWPTRVHQLMRILPLLHYEQRARVHQHSNPHVSLTGPGLLAGTDEVLTRCLATRVKVPYREAYAAGEGTVTSHPGNLSSNYVVRATLALPPPLVSTNGEWLSYNVARVIAATPVRCVLRWPNSHSQENDQTCHSCRFTAHNEVRATAAHRVANQP